jgi:hypothetical protein
MPEALFMSDLVSFLLGFGFNFVIALLLVRFIYYPVTHNKRYVFTFLAFNTVIYFVLSFLTSIEISLGVGFGLFAIFTILRYRTDPIPVREMTYLFVIVALPVMNSASNDSTLWPQLVAANLATLVILFILEREWGFHFDSSKRILYEKIELIRPDRYEEMLADLENRTGLKIKRISIGKVNFLRDTADLTVYFDERSANGWVDDEEAEIVQNNKDDADD